jgi:hypothetical protein
MLISAMNVNSNVHADVLQFFLGHLRPPGFNIE